MGNLDVELEDTFSTFEDLRGVLLGGRPGIVFSEASPTRVEERTTADGPGTAMAYLVATNLANEYMPGSLGGFFLGHDFLLVQG